MTHDRIHRQWQGRTGKTTVATNLALAVAPQARVQLLDCDVEEPKAHIFLKPAFDKVEPVTVPVPEVNTGRCTGCGVCAEICAFNALAVVKGEVLVFGELCHGCGGCARFCPEQAITEVGREVGVVESGTAHGIEFVHGRLNPGEAMSPPVIRAVKQRIDQEKMVIIDVPPGTSCPVVQSVKGSDFCLLVTEPTSFGLNDLALSVQMLKALGVPAGVIINRFDIGDGRVEEYCREQQVPVLLSIPCDRNLAALYARGEPVVLADHVSETPYGPLVHARLGVAAENSGKLVTLVRKKAREMAEADKRCYIITDGPPGIGCPVIASMAGATAALIVTEPTLSGIHDLERVHAVCRHFSVPALVCINRFDLDEDNALRIEEWCRTEGVEVAGKIPTDRTVVRAMVEGLPVVEFSMGEASYWIRRLWERVRQHMSRNETRGPG